MEVESVLITGANRGIGLEFVRQFVKLPKPPSFVFATYRNENTLQDLIDIQKKYNETRIILIKMDVSKKSEIEKAKMIVEETVGEKGLNLLINNAGIATFLGFPEITEEDMLFNFTTNTIGPVMVLKAMFPLLKIAADQKSSGMNVSRAAAINISSTKGSLNELIDGQPKDWLKVFGYRTSKAALNMAMRVIALTIKEQDILVVNMCPGWVKTDLGTDQAALEPSESVSAMLKTFFNLNESHHGTFLDRNGSTTMF